jgi:hypothetical protein
MASKKNPTGGNLLAALGGKNAVKKAPKDPVQKRAKTGENEATGGQQHGELRDNSVPTHRQQLMEEARYQKRNATREWIAGRLSNKKHAGIHERANHVLTNQVPKTALPKGW